MSHLSQSDSLVCTRHVAHPACGGSERSRALWAVCVQAHNPFLEQLQEEREEEEEEELELYLPRSVYLVTADHFLSYWNPD